MSQLTKRKRKFVNRNIQGKILGSLAKYWIFYHLGIWCILFTFDLIPHIIAGLLNGTQFVLADFCVKFAREHFLVLTVPIVLFPVIMWDFLQVTHKVAGPLVRFRNALRDLAAGQTVEKIKLRNGDLLVEFQDAFNEFLDSDHVRNNLASNAVTQSESNSQEDAILDCITALEGELHDAESQSCSTAIH